MSFPYLDLLGVKRRSFLRPSYFDDVEGETPGYTAQCIATHSSTINSRLRKRYGAALPFGQLPPPLVLAGPVAPLVVLQGQPTLGSLLMLLTLTTAGPVGTAVFTWSSDGGITSTPLVVTAPSVPLGLTGMSAIWPVGTYNLGNVYAAAPPVPETILRWVTILVSRDVLVRHGVRTEDPLMVGMNQEVDRTYAHLEEAANQETGLFDLPTSEDAQTAISTGGPRSYTESSPYAWAYNQQRAARQNPCGARTNTNLAAPTPASDDDDDAPNGLVGS